MKKSVYSRIQKELDQIEQREHVRIIFACESGSRAWGFESEDSDYDVRFIYVRKTEWYLTIQNKRDVIEKPINDELDISGWDIRKALSLLKKSNPPLLEWLQSPIVYREECAVTARIREIMREYYSPKSCMYHYLHMARGNFREYLKGDRVWVKKYFYVLRPVLACIWIESGYGIVPTEFEKLLDRTIQQKDLKEVVGSLLEKKKAGKELDMGEKIPLLSDFLEKEITRLSAGEEPSAESKGYEKPDQVFVEILRQVNGPTIG